MTVKIENRSVSAVECSVHQDMLIMRESTSHVNALDWLVGQQFLKDLLEVTIEDDKKVLIAF